MLYTMSYMQLYCSRMSLMLSVHVCHLSLKVRKVKFVLTNTHQSNKGNVTFTYSTPHKGRSQGDSTTHGFHVASSWPQLNELA